MQNGEGRNANIQHPTSNIQHSRLLRSFHLLFFALGLMSKPMVVTLPFVLLLLDYWPLRKKCGAGGVRSGESRRDGSRGGC